jgi:hypothetical protein
MWKYVPFPVPVPCHPPLNTCSFSGDEIRTCNFFLIGDQLAEICAERCNRIQIIQFETSKQFGPVQGISACTQ